jgi:TctA family transporter
VHTTTSIVGLDPVAGYPRLTFGRPELLGGVPFIAALIGLFALAEAFRRIEQIALGEATWSLRFWRDMLVERARHARSVDECSAEQSSIAGSVMSLLTQSWHAQNRR